MDGYPLSHFVVACDSPKILDFLLQKFGVLDSFSRFQESLLHVAAEQQSWACLKLLLEQPDVDQLLKEQDSEGETALMKLAQTVQVDAQMVEKLRLFECELGISTSEGETAFSLFMKRLVEEEIFFSEAFQPSTFAEVVRFFAKDRESGPEQPHFRELLQHNRLDLFNALGDLVSFTQRDFEAK